MSKNIVLFVDGTNNWGERDALAHEETNVWTLYQLCNDPLRLYLRGVGSWKVDIGGIAGFGTKKRLRKAYDFLVEHYSPGDNIFLFGFSRGALAVRLFAGFLGYVGTLFGGPLYRRYLPHVYQIYQNSVLLNNIGSFHEYMRHFGETTPLPIHFLGVWDTVEEYWASEKLPELESLPEHISYARQALALHERRGEMEPTLWTRWNDRRSNVQQFWFPGAHADVGGGYSDAKLAEGPLIWMRDQAAACQLAVRSFQSKEPARVLHQQRTHGRIVGQLMKYFKGERPRRALVEFANLPAQCRDSFSLHQSACDQLLYPLTAAAGYLGFGTAVPADAGNELKTIDTITLQLALSLRHPGSPGWWAELTAADAANSGGTMDSFLDQPMAEQVDSFATALALRVLLGGDDRRVCEKLGKLVDDHLLVVREGLAQAEAKLLEAGGVPSEALKASIETLKQRRDEQFDRNVAASAKGRPLKLKKVTWRDKNL